MSEMLANQYFMAKNYLFAVNALEKALLNDPNNKGMRSKLVICYTQTGKIKNAWDIFISLVEDDVDYILNCDPFSDDCPCSEILSDFEKKLQTRKNSIEYLLSLGMLWLYCDINKSIQYFLKAQTLDKDSSSINYILFHLVSYINKKTN